MLLGLLGLIVLLLVLRFHTKQVSVKVGDIFSSNIKAPYSGTDSFLTDKARQKAREDAPIVYETSDSLVQQRKAAVEGWFTNFQSWLGDMVAVWEQDTEILEGKYRFRGLNTTWKQLISEAEMAQALVRRGISDEITATVAFMILDTYMPANTAHAIGETVDAADFKKAFTDIVYTLFEEGTDEKALSKTRTSALTAIKKKSLLSALKTEVAGKLLDKFLLPTIAVDEASTEENRRLAASIVPDVHITRGEVLFAKGASVTAEDITHLTALGLLKGAGGESAFSFPSLLIYATLCIIVTGIWLLLFEKPSLLRLGTMGKLTVIYAVSVILAFAFSFFKAEGAPVLFALLCAAEEGKKEHSVGALLFSVMVLPVLLDTDAPFGAEGMITGASLLMGGICACGAIHIPKGTEKSMLPAGILGGTVIGIIRLCPLLWENASGVKLMMGFGFPFLGGLLAAILGVVIRPILRRLSEFDRK